MYQSQLLDKWTFILHIISTEVWGLHVNQIVSDKGVSMRQHVWASVSFVYIDSWYSISM